MVKILYHDNHLLVLEKPADMLTQPVKGSCVPSLEEWGKEFLKKEYEKKGNVFLEAVHRLDRPVSGIVLFARTSKALSRMQEKVRQKLFKKVYLARVEGHFEWKEGVMEDFLSHDDFKAMEDHNGKPSQLRYKVISESENESLVEIELITGRYHQIRFQFSKRGHPIVGDEKYGSKKSLKKILLHHHRLEIIHPVTTLPLIFNSPAAFFQ